MRRIGAAAVAAGVATAASLAVATPASATTAGCGSGRIASIANNLPIREQSGTDSKLITTAQKGYQYNCVDVWLASWYTACGVNTNRWIQIAFRSGLRGWTYASCVEDVW